MTHHLKQHIRQGWEQTAARYAVDRPQVFQRFAERLVALADSPAQRVLDVGTGTGAVAVRVAERVSPGGQVIAVDLAWAMAARVPRQDGLATAQMDAEALGFPTAHFDRVTCAFSLFQFPDMRRALAEMRRVLRPGGQLALSNWGPGFVEPAATMQRDLFRAFGLRPLIANPITFRPEQLNALLQAAGFAAIELIQEQVELCFGGPEEIWEWNLAMGPLPVMLEQQLTPRQRDELHTRYLEMFAPLQTPQGIACTFYPLYALAR